MEIRKSVIMTSAVVILLCVALIPVFLGIGALRFDSAPVPLVLWWLLGVACLLLISAITFFRGR